MDPEKTKYSCLREQLIGLGLALPTGHVGEGDAVAAMHELTGDTNLTATAGYFISDEGDQYRNPGFHWESPRLPSKSSFVGNVSHVDWDCTLYLSSLEENFDNLKIIGSVLQNKYEGSSPGPQDLQWGQGEACIAQFSLDKMWYRGEVLEVTGQGVLVKFVDYGSVELCKPQNMRKELFMKNMPIQCLTVQLEIAPLSRKWGKGVLDFIHMTIIDKPMNVTVVENKKGFPLIVRMTTQAGLDITDLLVNNGYARLNRVADA